MGQHGKAPTNGWIRRYFRWCRGQLHWVQEHPRNVVSLQRGAPPEEQLDFGF
jgi:hypothetical protein